MAKVSLNSVITEKFISRLAAAGKQGSSAPTNPLKGSSSVSLSGSLRLGAQTYATAVGALNNTLSIVNVARGTLENLGELTDKMIEVTEKAARRGVGVQGRRALDLEFRDLANDFKKIIEKAEVGDKNLLSVDGLTELFLAVGLDKETSSSIAEVFSKFMTPEDDPNLASEKIEGKKPLVIPASAFTVPGRAGVVELETLTDAPLTSVFAGISPNTSIFQATDDILNENPGVDAVFVRETDGTVKSQGAGGLQGMSATLRAVNEVTGYSIIESSFDPFGQNSGGDSQLFLLDERGALVGQLTNYSGATFNSVDMASSDEMFAVGYFDGSRYRVDTIEVLKGEPASTATVKNILDANDILSDVKIDNEGAFVAFQREKPGPFSNIELYDVTNLTFDNPLSTASRSRDPLDFGFVGPSGVVAYSITISTGAVERDVISYDPVAGGTTLLSAVTYDSFATLQNNDGGNVAIVEVAGSDRTVQVFGAIDGSSVYSLSIGGDAVSFMSLAQNASDPSRIDIGLVGVLPGISGDGDMEFYRIRYNPEARVDKRISGSTTTYPEILDDERRITSRPDAYRMLNDLKALREQITENVDALSNAFNVVSDNISLVRATGLALLEIGNELTSETDAAAVAESLRRRIRESAGEALAQAENLDPIAVATLTYTSSGN